MIERIWHGWTSLDNAQPYEELLKTEIFVHITDREIGGFKGIRLLTRRLEKEVEFVTLMRFDSIGAVIEFAGPDFQKSVVPEKAQRLLSRYDEQARHYEVKEDIRLDS